MPTLFTPPAHVPLDSGDVMAAKPGLRGATLSAKGMPTAAFEGGITRTQTGSGSDQLNEAALQIVERQLAAFIGPLAKVLVKRAATKTTSAFELYTILAAVLEREEDRKAFLARRAELGGSKASPSTPLSAPVQAVPTVIAAMDVAPPSEITPAAIEQAARKLAAHLGPIATVLAKKDAKRAATLRDFYGLLAEHVTNPSDRERFLKEAGVQ
jgi:serine/threonine-protein kinase